MNASLSIPNALVRRVGTAPALAAAFIILTAQPAVWLGRTLMDGGLDSAGPYVLIAVAGLGLWSLSSPRRDENAPWTDAGAWRLLILSALVRLAGRVLAIQFLGALTLAVDVYALSRLAGLDRRVRSVSPFFLSILFCFVLPVERVLQRTVGYGLQRAATLCAGGLVDLAGIDAHWDGVVISAAGRTVLVDLPCSGARGLVLLAALFVGLSAVIRPRPAQAAGGAAAAFLGALLGNAFRVALLTLGMVSPWAGSVAEGPGHEAIGLLTLAFSALPLILWARRIARAGELGLNPFDRLRKTAVIPQAAPTVGKGRRLWAWGFLAAAVAVNLAPPRPLDVSRSVPSLYAPKVLNGRMGEAVPLEPKEREYFLKYGGQALKTRYGDRALLLVRTSAPFRHLHAPDECLRGLGYQVQSAGFRPGPLPATEYRAAGPDGRIWRVSVTFLSDQGDKTPNMTEALWRWLIQPGSVWTAVQRIRPWDEPLAEPGSSGPDAWEQAVAAALDAHDWPTPERLSTPGLLAARPDLSFKRGTP